MRRVYGFSKVTLDAVHRHSRLLGLSAVVPVVVFLLSIASGSHLGAGASKMKTGSVIFIHPDGSGIGGWTALRLVDRGPDGQTNWDRMEAMGVYRGHLRNSLVSSSHGGATAHAYGVKPSWEHYGTNDKDPIRSLSRQPYSIMVEAQKAGRSVGIINSGQIAEPGTGVFVASVEKRAMREEITEQVIRSGADIIMAGGEAYLLPEGVEGMHGEQGTRKDGKNLIRTAVELGYTLVFSRDELMAVPDDVDKLLGLFGSKHTFNDKSEEVLSKRGYALYGRKAPTVAEMTEVALRILKRKGKDFLLVVEEEGTDNFGNVNNAQGYLEAIRRADAAIGVAMDYIEENPNTLLLTAADSDAGGLRIVRVADSPDAGRPVPKQMENGAPIDGRDGTESLPFIAAPDRNGRQLPFALVWAGFDDLGGGIVARAHGLNADRLPRNVDNTDIYRMMYATLFGTWLP
jgi:alkaline phosphatase